MKPTHYRSLPGCGDFPGLIVNADDFGISEAVNRGIADAHCRGVVTAASLMAVGAAFDHAAMLCRSLPELDIGVHLSLVAEKPILPGRFSNAGKKDCFPDDVRALLKDFFSGRILLSDIQAEWSAQIEKVLDLGIRVTHLDSHQHVHALPGVLELTDKLAQEYHIPFIRIPSEDRVFARPITIHGLMRTAGAMALRSSLWIAALYMSRKDSLSSPRFLGFYEGGRLDEKSLEKLLTDLKPGVIYELMCHPGLAPKETHIRRWQYRHEDELRALVSPGIRSIITARNIRLCRFSDLLSRSCKPHPVLGADGK